MDFEKNRSQRLKTRFFPQNPQRKTPQISRKKHKSGILSTKNAQINLYRGITRKFWEKLRVIIHIKITDFGKIEQKIHIFWRFIHNSQNLSGIRSTWNTKNCKKFGWMFHMKHFLFKNRFSASKIFVIFDKNTLIFLTIQECEKTVKFKWYI